MNENTKYMELAIKEAEKAYKKGEVPVGAVIIKDGKVIAKAHNQKEKSKIATYHAEILAIMKANKKLKDWRLNNCTIYVTLEPCMMCYAALKEARIEKIIYAVDNQNKQNNCNVDLEQITCKNTQEKCKKILLKFFKNQRNSSFQ